MNAIAALFLALGLAAGPEVVMVKLNDKEAMVMREKTDRSSWQSAKRPATISDFETLFVYVVTLQTGSRQEQQKVFCERELAPLACANPENHSETIDQQTLDNEVTALRQYGQIKNKCWSGSRRDRKEFTKLAGEILAKYSDAPEFGCRVNSLKKM